MSRFMRPQTMYPAPSPATVRPLRSSRRRRRLAAIPAVILSVIIALASLGRPANAMVYLPTSLDRIVLTSDRISYVEVLHVASTCDSTTAYSVEVRVVEDITVPADSPAEFMMKIPSSGAPCGGGAVQINGYGPALHVGARFLLFLRRAGAGDYEPIRFYTPVYPVLADGTVGCPGGKLWGLSATGLVCSKATFQIGEAPSAQQVAEQLRHAYAVASRRRGARFTPPTSNIPLQPATGGVRR